jgi:hypothetical protein
LPLGSKKRLERKLVVKKVLKSTENGKFTLFVMMHYFQLFLHIALIQCTRGKMSDFMLNLMTTHGQVTNFSGLCPRQFS